MSYRIAGVDVHKRMFAVVVSDVEVVGEFAFERRQFGSTPAQLPALAEWLIAQQVEEVVMESTAQFGKPVWASLERDWKPFAQQRGGDFKRTIEGQRHGNPRGSVSHCSIATGSRGAPKAAWVPSSTQSAVDRAPVRAS
jgi:hypothetical protein